MKKIPILLALACLLTALCGCGGKKAMDPQALADELLNNAKFSDSLDRMEDDVIPLVYGIDKEDCAAALVYAGAGGVTAEEIAVFTAVDAAAADRILSAAKALAGREHILAAYEEAVRERYRFFSFGDAMFIH